MAKIKDIQLTAPLVDHLVRRLEEVPDPVLELAAKENALPGGFTKAPAIRKRLAAMIHGQGPLPEWVQILVHIPGRDLVSLLSSSTLQDLQDLIATTVGPDNLTLAMLQDDREPIRQLGVRWMEHPRPAPDEETTRRSGHLLADILHCRLAADLPLQNPLPGKEASEESIPPGDTSSETESPHPDWELIERIAALEDKLRDQETHLDNARKRHKADKREADAALKAREEQLQRERHKLREQLESLAREKSLLEQENQSLKSNQAQAIAAGVEQETSFLKRAWLTKAQSVEEEVEKGQSDTEDLLTRARHVVHLQAEQDRHTGNRQALHLRLSQLRQARLEVGETLEHALHPLPDLDRMLQALDREMERIQHLLGTRPPEEALTSRLLQRINQATALPEVRPLSELIETLGRQNLLIPSDRKRLYDAVYKKYSLLEDSTRRPAKDEEADDGWNLRSQILNNRPIVIFVDGHNLLLAPVDGEMPAAGIRESEARQQLIRTLARLVADAPEVQLTAFFDGPARHTESITPNFRVEYSGGRGEHRADRRIAEELEFRARASAGRTLHVVSNDHEVRQNALRLGARFVPVEAFAALLPGG